MDATKLNKRQLEYVTTWMAFAYPSEKDDSILDKEFRAALAALTGKEIDEAYEYVECLVKLRNDP